MTAWHRELEDRGRDSEGFPNALATMWTWVAKDRAEGERVLSDVLAPRLNRDPDELRNQLCIGPAQHCAALLSDYAAAGCHRVYLWPLGDERRQIELVASEVAPRIERLCHRLRSSRQRGQRRVRARTSGWVLLHAKAEAPLSRWTAGDQWTPVQSAASSGMTCSPTIRTCSPRSGKPSTSIPAQAFKVNGSVNDTRAWLRPGGA